MLVGIVMGSYSDWPIMENAAKTLEAFYIAYESLVVSAHRTPDLLFKFAEKAKDYYDVIIAGAGGAAHLPAMLAAKTTVPILGVPIESAVLRGLDSLLSISQMPEGVPVATFSIGKAGAVNAALFAMQIMVGKYPHLNEMLDKYRLEQTTKVLDTKIE